MFEIMSCINTDLKVELMGAIAVALGISFLVSILISLDQGDIKKIAIRFIVLGSILSVITSGMMIIKEAQSISWCIDEAQGEASP